MNRRLILLLIAGAVVLPRMTHALPAPQATPRRLRLVNPHTGETFNGPYRDDHGPLATAMADLSVFLRDFHSGATVGIDVAVIDFLAAVMDAVDAQSAAILSAYRTPETNAMLERTTFGVAENSQHLYGRALDIHFGSKLAEAMLAARAMQRGGVGWYPIPNSSISIRDRCETGTSTRTGSVHCSSMGSVSASTAKRNR